MRARAAARARGSSRRVHHRELAQEVLVEHGDALAHLLEQVVGRQKRRAEVEGVRVGLPEARARVRGDAGGDFQGNGDFGDFGENGDFR